MARKRERRLESDMDMDMDMGSQAGRDRVHEAYAKLGHLGGEKVKEKYGDAFFSRIGEKGGQARKAQMARGIIAKNPTAKRELELGEPLPQPNIDVGMDQPLEPPLRDMEQPLAQA